MSDKPIGRVESIDGPWGDSVRCERPRGHDGDHLYTMRWGDAERSR